VKTYPAQIVFLQVENADLGGSRRWRGRLLRPSGAIDTETGRPVTWTPIFDLEEGRDGKVHVTMQGGPDKGGRRYASHPNVTEAQKAGIRWAGRRFRIPVEVSASP
jgi:hypothetical protein